ncbi:Ubiquitin-like domain-containing CTD phosphatase 1 [Fragariocoptes setiger]|uniref:Ubiquitin-like domain-containing CTD phosphatase 1 n=1 Tax=Fragariocoptes setiger TaxID=1670756 RepID=A0ABQ7SCX6_9ACAR|nr:Ubiquitin-like domain-containing CTD phosphatase 1 [Fragariocoptes setiger]
MDLTIFRESDSCRSEVVPPQAENDTECLKSSEASESQPCSSKNDESAPHTMSITVRFRGIDYNINDIHVSNTIGFLKHKIHLLTSVRPERQKLFGFKSLSASQPLSDTTTIDATSLRDKSKVIMMGSVEDDIKVVENVNKDEINPFFDDFDIFEDDETMSDVGIANRQEYLTKIARRVQEYQIEMINPPREGKKLLVLDIDYTLFDHKSTAQSADELMRPYLHEFLASAYHDYDIVIWSATSITYIKAKMRQLRVENHPLYKIMFYLDSRAMISVHSAKYGLLNVKPLAVIWGKFPQYSEKNTIMFDDIRRNFLMNAQSGLKIKAYRDSHKNRATDAELLHLSQYLKKIAKIDDFTKLNHKHWHKYVEGSRRH